jgi:hypothetical protein
MIGRRVFPELVTPTERLADRARSASSRKAGVSGRGPWPELGQTDGRPRKALEDLPVQRDQLDVEVAREDAELAVVPCAPTVRGDARDIRAGAAD